jgi:hypothetical protein
MDLKVRAVRQNESGKTEQQVRLETPITGKLIPQVSAYDGNLSIAFQFVVAEVEVIRFSAISAISIGHGGKENKRPWQL